MIASIMDRQVDIEVATLILAIVGVGTILVVGAILITMMHRQRSDLAYNRRIASALIELSVQLEHEERRSRHAIKNLAYTLTNLMQYWQQLPVKVDFTSVAESLEQPPLADARSGALLDDLAEARSRAGTREEQSA